MRIKAQVASLLVSTDKTSRYNNYRLTIIIVDEGIY